MITKVKYPIILIILLFFSRLMCFGQGKYGAAMPWTTFEAENMLTNGTILGPKYEPYQVETESSGQRCVKLASKGQFVEFTSSLNVNSMVIRFSLPDNSRGTGTNCTLGVYKNGSLLHDYKISSRYAWLYGKYPFSNDPIKGEPRHFYDEIRINDVEISLGDIIRVQRDDQKDDDAGYCIIDLVDLENVAPPLSQPVNSLSITDKNFLGANFNGDYTEGFRNCIAKAVETGKTVWLPVGVFKITGDIVLPSNIIIQGAGIWYTQLTGDDALYTDVNERVRLKGNGSNIHIADFSITGKLNYRSDKEANDGIVGSYGTNSTISRIWIEHTKVGMWIENSNNLRITDCRMRNTMADGINFCVGMVGSTIENCTARGTGDDCFAIWPTTFLKQVFSPGHNRIVHCTATLPYLANGAAIYGGESNSIQNCSMVDISQGSAVLISTTFPTESKDKSINNNFSGNTVVEDCSIKTSGGFDHEWGWRAAIEICLDRRSISGLEIKNINITNSLSNGLSVIAKNQGDKMGVLYDATVKNVSISNSGIAIKTKYDLFINGEAHGSLIVRKSEVAGIMNESTNFVIEK